MKFLKVYTDVITGSMAGRDDGYPCTKYVVYNNIEQLAKNMALKLMKNITILRKLTQKN